LEAKHFGQRLKCFGKKPKQSVQKTKHFTQRLKLSGKRSKRSIKKHQHSKIEHENLI